MSIPNTNLVITNLKYVSVCDLCRFMPPINTDENPIENSMISAVCASIGFHMEHPVAIMANKGETLFSYIIRAAADHNLKAYLLKSQVEQICQSLLSGRPVICKMSTFAEFNGTEHVSGALPMPASQANSSMYVVCITGFDDQERQFYVRHNQGVEFGLNGYYTIPFDYILKYSKALISLCKDSEVVIPVESSPITKPAPVEEPVIVPINIDPPSAQQPTLSIEETMQLKVNKDIRILHLEQIKQNIIAVVSRNGLTALPVLMSNIGGIVDTMLKKIQLQQ